MLGFSFSINHAKSTCAVSLGSVLYSGVCSSNRSCCRGGWECSGIGWDTLPVIAGGCVAFRQVCHRRHRVLEVWILVYLAAIRPRVLWRFRCTRCATVDHAAYARVSSFRLVSLSPPTQLQSHAAWYTPFLECPHWALGNI